MTCKRGAQNRFPKHPINFAAAYADAKFHFDTFRMLGNELIEQAQDAFSESRNMRLAALFMAHTKQLRGLDAEADGTARPSGRTAAGDEG